MANAMQRCIELFWAAGQDVFTTLLASSTLLSGGLNWHLAQGRLRSSCYAEAQGQYSNLSH